jgi:hypothetical protein
VPSLHIANSGFDRSIRAADAEDSPLPWQDMPRRTVHVTARMLEFLPYTL